MSKNNNLLLINPWIYDFAAYDYWAKPLGLLYIASYLREAGYNISFIDCLDPFNPAMEFEKNFKKPKRRMYGTGQFHYEIIETPKIIKIDRYYKRYGITPQVFINDLKNVPYPDVILVTSMMTYWYEGVFAVIKIVKEMFPKVPVILGGVYATLCKEHALKYSQADYVIEGPGEIEALNLVNKITGNDFKVEGDRLTHLLYPAFDLYPKLEYICTLTSRGCPLRCTYCACFKLFPKFFVRPVEDSVEELTFWSKSGIVDIALMDDALLLDSENHFIPIMEEVIRRKLNLRFHTPNALHIKEITPEVAKILYKSGFVSLRLALETINEERQKQMGGKVNVHQFKEAVKNLRNVGFNEREISVYLMALLPFQRWKEVEEGIKLVFDVGARPVIVEYSPIPGTLLWEDAKKCSRFDLEKDPLYHNNSIFPCLWEGFDNEAIKKLKNMVKQV